MAHPRGSSRGGAPASEVPDFLLVHLTDDEVEIIFTREDYSSDTHDNDGQIEWVQSLPLTNRTKDKSKAY